MRGQSFGLGARPKNIAARALAGCAAVTSIRGRGHPSLRPPRGLRRSPLPETVVNEIPANRSNLPLEAREQRALTDDIDHPESSPGDRGDLEDGVPVED